MLANATYSANCTDNIGFITALTVTENVSAGSIGTTTASLPGTILSYASDSPNTGTGNIWTSTANKGDFIGSNGSTYYYQLWVKGNIDAPTIDNERFYIVPYQMP